MFLSAIYRYVCRRIAGDFWKNGRIPPLLQMIYGRPQLEFAADEFTGPDSKQLIVGIKAKGLEANFCGRSAWSARLELNASGFGAPASFTGAGEGESVSNSASIRRTVSIERP